MTYQKYLIGIITSSGSLLYNKSLIRKKNNQEVGMKDVNSRFTQVYRNPESMSTIQEFPAYV